MGRRVTTTGFKVQGDQVSFALTTEGEQEFTQDRYRIDLKIEATRASSAKEIEARLHEALAARPAER